MAELNSNQTSNQSQKNPIAEKPTVVDLKFTLTKRKKITIALAGILSLLLVSSLAIWFTDLKYTVFGLFTKASAEVVVADSKTLQPIKEATVSIDDMVVKTDEEGKATLSDLSLGRKKLTVTKEAYKNFERDEVIFIGVNKLEPVVLEGAGIAISFVVKNKITDSPIEGVEIKVKKNSAKTAKDGTAVLNILPTGGVKSVAKISKNGFIDTSLEFMVEKTTKPLAVKLTPAGKNYFLSNRRGKIDLFKSNLDGTKQSIILEATGNEEINTSILTSPNNKWVALLSTREAVKGASGDNIPILYMINPSDKSSQRISSEIGTSIIGWVNDYLIYSTHSGNYDNPEGKIVSFNVSSKTKVVLEEFQGYTGNIQLFENRVVYSLPDKTFEKYGLFIRNPDGSNHETVLTETVYTTYKTSASSIVFQSDKSKKWYSYDADSKQLKKLSSKPPSLKNKKIIFSPSKQYTAFIENRDGKNELFLADSAGENEKKLTSIGSASDPIRWVGDDYIIFSSSKNNETADYIVGRAGGKPQKVVDIYVPPPYPN
jgi:hypothetical protein